MTITPIDKAVFDGLNLPMSCSMLWDGGEERAWFADPQRTVVGVVTAGTRTPWRFFVCVRDAQGGYACVSFGDGRSTLESASRELCVRLNARLQGRSPSSAHANGFSV